MTMTEQDIQAAVRRALAEDRQQLTVAQSREDSFFAAAFVCAAVIFAVSLGTMWLVGYFWPGSTDFMWGDFFGLSFWGCLICTMPIGVVSAFGMSFPGLWTGGQTGTGSNDTDRT